LVEAIDHPAGRAPLTTIAFDRLRSAGLVVGARAPGSPAPLPAYASYLPKAL